MATTSVGVGMQVAVLRELERLMGTANFPGCTHAPFTSDASWKVATYPYHAMAIPPGARTVLALLTVNGQSIAVTVSARMVVTRAHLPTLPKSMFAGSVFDGYLERSDTVLRFRASDCLAFKGVCDTRFNLNRRMAGVSALLNSIAGSGDDRARLCVEGCERQPLATVPRVGTWLFCPEDLGFRPGRLQPDTYVACLDDVLHLVGAEPRTEDGSAD